MEPALHKAASKGNVANLRHLVASDLKILNSMTPQGNTALHIAAYHGHTDFAREILVMRNSVMSGELLFGKNHDGDTPLHLAAKKGMVDVADLLIRVVFLSSPYDKVIHNLSFLLPILNMHVSLIQYTLSIEQSKSFFGFL